MYEKRRVANYHREVDFAQRNEQVWRCYNPTTSPSYSTTNSTPGPNTPDLDLVKPPPPNHIAVCREAREQLSAWLHCLQAHQRAEGVYERKREAGQGGSRRNASSQAYNILTLHYAPTPDGQALKQKEARTEQRAVLRAQTLYSKGHCTSHNILTGQPVWPGPA
ncbi:hypothetical protein QJQ45_024534 [Haematococcus lacustris]|nr:hypothetical protein QJQ45_024534 [Haematococcus lacustris]